jgi:WD40 repeat protein/class 3 adenylate cyclase
METEEAVAGDAPLASIRTFLIADIRGYSTFTRERGDPAAARLAARFADLARDCAEARGGRVIELRGDEALAVFGPPEQAVRAAIEFQQACLESTAEDPELALPIGVGIDSGEAIAVEDGYRGKSLNLAARLCAKAQAGQVLVTRAVADAAAAQRDVVLEPRGQAELKGFDAPVEVFEALVPAAIARRPEHPSPPAALPVELEDDTPLAGRERHLQWLRGTWRQARRGHGRVVFVSGPAGIGKTRLAAELARWVHAGGGEVVYAGTGGAAAAQALAALDRGARAERPGLIVLDQLDVLSGVTASLADWIDDVATRPVLIVGLIRSTEGHGPLADLVARMDVVGDAHRALGGLPSEAVRDIVAQYAGPAADDAPVEAMTRSTGGIPARVHEVAAEWARDEGGRRLAAAAEWLAQGRARQAAGLDLTATAIGIRLGRVHGHDGTGRQDVCPYKGLAPFRPEDASLFFGRERLIGDLAARTVGRGLLVVAGASGSGKSSVVMGGLLPSLAAGLLPGSERWHLATMRPGERPRDALDHAIASDGGERLVLTVDQFEELFTLVTDEGQRRGFVDRLVELTRDPDRGVVILTVRGDHLGSVAPYPELADLLAENLVLMGTMSPDELRSVIELPSRRAGLRVESALVEALVEEAVDEPGALPLLSTALVELWQAREAGWLRMEAYERTGGIRGAVARLAEESFGRLDGPQREAARAMLLRLASGEADVLSRRRVPIEEFEPDTDPVRVAVLARFVEDRLLTVSERTVEVAHEALLREWPRLRGWLEEDAEGRVLRQRLTEASTQWVRASRDTSELLRGPRLSAAVDWATLHGRELNTIEQEFLAASRSAAQAELQRERRTSRRLRALLVGVAVFLVVALVAGSLALVQRSHARTAATRAELAATISLANTLGAEGIGQPRLDRGLLLAREAVNIHLSDQTKSDLLSTVLRNPRQIGGIYFGDTGKRPQSVSLSPDGRILAVSFNENDVGFYDASTLAQLAVVPNFGGPRAPLVFAGHAPMFATFGDDTGDVRLIDTRTFRHGLLMRFHQEYSNPNYNFHLTRLFFSSDDRTLWWGFEVWPPNVFDPNARPTSVIESYSVSTGRLLTRTVVDNDWQMSIAPTDNGSHVVVVDGRAAFVYDAGGTRLLRRIPLHGMEGGDLRLPVAVSPDERTLAIGQNDGSVTFVSLANGHRSIAAGGHTTGVSDLRFTPDGLSLITVGEDGRVVVWDVASRSVAETLLGHGGPIHGVATDGRTLFTSSLDGTVFVWDLSGTRSFGRQFSASSGDFLEALGQAVPYFALSRDGRTLAAPQTDGRVLLWDISTSPPRLLETVDAVGPGGVGTVGLSPDGRTLLASDVQGNVVLIDLRTHQRRSLSGLTDWVAATAFSPSGRQVAAASFHCGPTVPDDQCHGELALWSVSTGALAHPLMRLAGFGDNVAFSPDGSKIALPVGSPTGTGPTDVIDLRTWRVVRQVHPDADGYAAFSPDGGLLATTGGAGLARIWDTHTWKEVGQPFGISAGFGLSLAFDPTGRLLATAGTDGSVRMFDVSNPSQPVPFGPPSLLKANAWTSARFTPDGSSLVALDEHGLASIWPMRWQVWAAHACAVARRELSRSEWSEFVENRPYQPVCPSSDAPTSG